MLRILCTGDSHTWGQGVAGLWESLDPPCQNGELRLCAWRFPNYVNELRRMVEAATGSRSFEWEAQDLAKLANAPYQPPCAQIQSLQLNFEGALLRLEYAPGPQPIRWQITVDSRQEVLETSPSTGDNDYRFYILHLPEGNHSLHIQALSSPLPVYRLEVYSGSAAVINSGIGSCPTFRYREEYWDTHVTPLKPDIILAEAHTINDWLSGITPDEYRTHTAALLRDFRSLGAIPILLTVCPIGGAQKLPQTADDYRKYIHASRLAAEEANVPLCDANTLYEIMLEGLSEEEAGKYLLTDVFHPNERGHAVYTTMLAQMLRNLTMPDGSRPFSNL